MATSAGRTREIDTRPLLTGSHDRKDPSPRFVGSLVAQTAEPGCAPVTRASISGAASRRLAKWRCTPSTATGALTPQTFVPARNPDSTPEGGAVLFERVPRRMLGRVNALGDSLAWAGIPLGGLLAGAAVASVGLVPVLLACGTVYFLTTNLTGLRPEWREMDRARRRGVVTPHTDEDAPRGSVNVTT